jgi:serine protease Do
VTEPRSTSQNSPITTFIALAAAVIGVALLVVAVYRGIDLLTDDGPEIEATPTPTTAASGTTRPAATFDPGAFVSITDDSGRLSVSVPAEWSDQSGAAWTVDGSEVGVALSAAPDLDAWYSEWGTPGVFIGASDSGHVATLDDFSGVCTLGNSAPRSGGSLTGTVQAWSDCGAEGGSFYVFAGATSNADVQVLIQLVDTEGSGLAVLDELLTTFRYE